MTAEATGVKKIAVTFNQAVDTTATTITVKKGSATPTIAATTYATDAASAELVMGTKLTEGTYTVEVTSGEKVLTADITVKDETLTSFALVSNNLVADPETTTKASISYKALNQYGEMMAADSVTPTCSFGTIEPGNYTVPTADKAGKIIVTDIPATLAIAGTTGTLVIVETTNGVNLNETITYQSKAVASTATVYGIYSSKTEKLVEGNLKTGEKVTNYSLLVNVQDQYGSDMTPADIVASKCDVTYNAASVLTNVSVKGDKVEGTESELTYDGKNCFLVKLTAASSETGAIEKAGTMSLTMVSANKGVIASPSFTIEDAVLIQSLSVSAKDTVYADQDNELVVEAIDVNGNTVTSYDDLSAAIGYSSVVTLKKNSDGTGTFYYNPGKYDGYAGNAPKYKDSTIKTLIFTANDTTSGNYIVKTVNMTVYAKRQAWKVAGTTSDTVTAVASGASLVFKLSTLNYEDQYSNTLAYSNSLVELDNITGYLADDNNVFGGTQNSVSFDSDGKLTLTAGANKGTATLYLKYKNAADKDVATADKYDVKVTLSVVDVSGVTADDLKVTVNNGNAIYGYAPANLKLATDNATASIVTDSAFDVNVVVTGTVNGKTVVIPVEQCTIVAGSSLGDYGAVQAVTNPAKTEEKTVTVVVQSEEGPQTVSAKVTVSNVAPAASSIKAADSTKITVSTGTNVTSAELFGTVKVMNQYGTQMTDKERAILYTVTATGDNADKLTLTKNATMDTQISASIAGTYTASVTYKLGDIVFTQDITIVVE